MTQKLNIAGIDDKDISLHLKFFAVYHLTANELNYMKNSREPSETLHSSSRSETFPMFSADGVVEQDNHYYPYGMLMGESSNILLSASKQRLTFTGGINPYRFGSKEYLTTNGANLLDFTARTYDPATLLFLTPDPKATKYTSLNSYLYCGSDPVNRVDPSGMEWSISKSDDGKLIKIHFTGVVINNSAKEFDLNEVAKAIENQLKKVYTFSNNDVSVTMSAEIRAVTSAEEIQSTDHVFRIQNQSSFGKGVLAYTTISSLDIRLGTKLVEETLSGENMRTIAHEVGHTGGLDDTNLPSNQLPIDAMNSNLMTQIASLDKGTDVNRATKLQTNQINEIVNMYRQGKLNQNSPLRKRYNPQLHSTWPYITITSKYLCR